MEEEEEKNWMLKKQSLKFKNNYIIFGRRKSSRNWNILKNKGNIIGFIENCFFKERYFTVLCMKMRIITRHIAQAVSKNEPTSKPCMREIFQMSIARVRLNKQQTFQLRKLTCNEKSYQICIVNHSITGNGLDLAAARTLC